MTDNYNRVCKKCKLGICEEYTDCVERKYTPVIHAIEHGATLEQIIDLLNECFNINELNIKGYTPIIVATLHSRHEIVKLLLNRGADISIVDKDGYTFNDYTNKSVKVGRSCDKNFNGLRNDVSNEPIHAHFNYYVSIDEKQYTPVIYEVDEENIQKVEDLLNEGADVNELNIAGQTPLIRAALNYNFEIIKLLLNNNADINIVDKDGMIFTDYLLHVDYKSEVSKFLSKMICNIKPAKK